MYKFKLNLKAPFDFIMNLPKTPKVQTALWAVITTISTIATVFFATAFIASAVAGGTAFVISVGLPLTIPLAIVFAASYVATFVFVGFSVFSAGMTGVKCYDWFDERRVHYFGPCK
ncbi:MULTISPECIES: hypothetical protein [Parachlamydia]|jgi:hypothetical protein|uniref:Uncharacterized protein n=2 Tax=Parachlamydia acanthamoebae TaxID=83552 RepID=F8L121_PARAV|nr:hypothetical protein [Parachlamydia acanthamoebae]EFB42587.1 hypothetical protein pah_c004o092 [Parachlamydia acanthamoebae str. Hall's coccus]KIA77352.1 hypothetical protein DB43_GL00130 [Parachlamydia acanthamoebae]CCB86940.1 putative uncharacterized protein [Parachlamydia acanthamoebae UV-7]